MRLRRWLCLLLLSVSTSQAQIAFDLSVDALAVNDAPSPTFYVAAGGLFRGEGSLRELIPLHIHPVGQSQPVIQQVFADGRAVFARSSMPDELWRSEDEGASWTRIMDGLPEFESMVELFLLPGNPLGLMVYLRDGPDRWVYSSDDRGATWTLQTTLPALADEFGVNLNTPDIMFANVNSQVWRSLNRGQDWTRISTTPFVISNVNSAAYLVPDPLGATNVIIGGGGGGGNAARNGVYLSTDQGLTWTRVLTTVANTFIYGADWPYFFQRQSAVVGDIDVSRTRGLSWENVDIVPDSTRPKPTSAAVDPRNDQIVYLGTSAIVETPIFRSGDSARTWQPFATTVLPTLGGPTVPIVGEVPVGRPSRNVSATIGPVENRLWDIDITVDDPTVPWLAVEIRGRTLTLTFSSDGLELGEFRTDVTIRSSQTVNPSLSFPVTLRVIEAPIDTRSTISTFAGSGEPEISGDGGPALEAGLRFPADMAVGADASIYLTHSLENIIRKIGPDGVIDRFAGGGEEGFDGDGGPALQAQLNFPDGISAAPDGNVYFADSNNNRVRKVDTRGIISTFAGNGEFFGATPGAGPDATAVAMDPDSLTTDAQGNVFIQDGRTIYRVTPAGSYRTVTREGGVAFDDVTIDESGNLYSVRSTANMVSIISPAGDVETLAGAGPAGYTGDGGPALQATFDRPSGVAVGGGMVFIADDGNNVVRAVDANGIVQAFAGTGRRGLSGDGGPALSAELSRPGKVEYLDGRLYILDRTNRRIRVVERNVGGGPQLTVEGVVNAGGFIFHEVSAGENISLFGVDLAIEVVIASSTPLPAELGGTRVTITDSAGATRPCLLFFVAGAQINCNVDAATALGPATLTVETPEGSVSIQIVAVAAAPGLFSANATGAGVAAAVGIRVAADGSQSVVDVFDASVSPRVAVPIGLGPEGEQVVLLLFGTGFRNFEGSVEVTIGGRQAQVLGVAAQGEFVGLDQINVIIPHELIGAGEIEIRVVIDGRVANVVTVRIG